MAARGGAGARFLALGIAALLSSAQGPLRPIGEGPLGNDVFLPTSDAAAKALAAGDEALLRTEGDAAKRRDDALEAWWRALSESEAFDGVPVVGGGGSGTSTSRGTEPVEVAVARRLASAGPEFAGAWRGRFEEGAGSALAAAGDDPVTLARVERSFPATRSGARAALALADRAIESGARVSAETWLERAQAHADPADRPLADAIGRRADALRRFGTKAIASDPDRGWAKASSLSLASTVALPPEPGARADEKPREGIEPGIALLEDGRVCVQGGTSVHVVDPARGTESVELLSLVHGHGWVWPAPFAEEGERWPLLPATSGSRVFVVAGRAANAQGNALLALETRGAGARPELAWGYSDAGFLAPDGASSPMDEALGPGLWEFEPGPVVVEGSVVVQARQWLADKGEHPVVDERSVRSWCVAFDAANGATLWKRLVAVGASGKARLQGARGFAHPAQPLAVQGGRLLAGTGVGAAAWIDAADGRVTACLRYRRAPEGSRRWRLSAPLALDPESASGDGSPGPILWTPPDSDKGYVLYPERGGSFGGTFRVETREIGRDALPFAASGSRSILIAAGERASFGCLSLSTGARFDSLALERSDRPPSRGVASRHRLLAADDRALFLFDVDQELRLIAAVDLPGRADDPLGALAAREDRLYVAGERTLWILNAR
jgi:hypothetical protein